MQIITAQVFQAITMCRALFVLRKFLYLILTRACKVDNIVIKWVIDRGTQSVGARVAGAPGTAPRSCSRTESRARADLEEAWRGRREIFPRHDWLAREGRAASPSEPAGSASGGARRGPLPPFQLEVLGAKRPQWFPHLRSPRCAPAPVGEKGKRTPTTPWPLGPGRA